MQSGPGERLERLERFWRLYDTPGGKKMFRYVAQSVATTLFSFAILGLVYGVLRLWTEVPSTVFANVVATIPSYFLNRNWVWGKGGRSHVLREVVPFWVASIAGIILSIFTASEARHLGLEYFPHHHGLRTLLVEGANLFAFGLLWIFKFLVFNRVFRVHPVEDAAEEARAEADAEDGTIASPPVVSRESS
ncbi:MAG: GtrA family protein [Acidimicrobiales bacterium]